MRILIFTQQLAAFRSGVGTYAHSLVSGLNALGHDVTVVTADDEVLDIPGTRMIGRRRCALDPSPGGWVGLGIHFAGYLKTHARHFDIAHFTDAREGFAIRRCGIPVTATANDAYALDWIDPGYPRALFADRRQRACYYWLLRVAEFRTYRRFNCLIANSRHVRNRIVQGYRLDPQNVRVIYYGLEACDSISPSALPGSPSILFVGGNFLRKGLAALLDAVAQLKPTFAGIQLHVVGRDANQPVLKNQARRLGIVDCVTFHGWQPNSTVQQMMAGASMFVLPSLTEGFGLVYLEAMLAGTPVIATRFGGAHEVFEENAEAVFVSPGSVGELAEAIKRIGLDRRFADVLRQGGRNAASMFTVQAMVAQTETLWHSMVSR